MIVTRGDATSEIVSRFGLGEVIDYERDDELVAALLCLVEKPRSDYDAHFERARAELTWEQAARPLVAFLQHPRRAPDKVDGLRPPPAAWKWSELARAQSVEIDALRAAGARQDAEAGRLRALVTGYEQGRFIRLMKWLHNLRRRGTDT
jgi:hypothetical protein